MIYLNSSNLSVAGLSGESQCMCLVYSEKCLINKTFRGNLDRAGIVRLSYCKVINFW